MSFFSSLKVSTRLTLGFCVVAVIGIAIAAFSAMRLQILATDMQVVAKDRMVKVALFTQLLDNLNSSGRGLRNMILTDDAAVRTAEEKNRSETKASNTEILKTLNATVTKPEAVDLLKKINEVRPKYSATLDKVIAAIAAGDKAEASRVLLTETTPLQVTYFSLVGDSRKQQQTYAEELANEAAGIATAATSVMAVLGVLMVIISVFVTWLITRDLSRALGAEPGELSDVATRVAEGDLSVPLQVRGGDSTSVMATMARMQTALTHVVSSVRAGSESVATASAEIAQGNNDLSARTEQQASALEQTAASMEELGSTVRQNADTTHQANQLAKNASSVAVKGGAVVTQVVDTMKGINDSSRRIADIIQVIDGIAFQTNILALNAAVEAARAGEQGRGFAVVASEVRSLAGRSAEAAKEIKSLITASVERVEQGTLLVDQAGATMSEVVSAIGRVTDLMGEVSAASNEQNQGVAQIGEAVQQMDTVTQQNAALVEEMAAAASSLKSQAQELVQTVAIFKVGGHGASAGQRLNAPTLHSAAPKPLPKVKPALAKPATAARPAAAAKPAALRAPVAKPAAKPAAPSAPKPALKVIATSQPKDDAGEWESF